MQTRNFAWMIALLTTLVASASHAQSPKVNPDGWASPLSGNRSDPSLIQDYVPCLFDVDQSGNFRALKVPDLETQAQSQAKQVIQSSSLSSDQKAHIIADASKVALSTLSPQKIHDYVFQSTTNAFAITGESPEAKTNTAEALSTAVAVVVSQAGPIKKPSDVSCGMSVLPWTTVRWAFGREIAENFLVVQVTVRNLNNEQQFLVHDVELAVDTQPGVFNRFSSSVDQATVDGVALTAEEGWSSRDFWLRFATFVGSIVSAISVPVGVSSLKDAAGVYSGAFIPALNKLLKDHSAEQIARLDSSIFTNSQSRRVIVAKNDSATFDSFLPLQSLLQIDWENIYYYKTGAKQPKGDSTFILKSKKSYKDWSPLALEGLNNSTYVIVAGAHIAETSSQAQITSFSCPPNDSPAIDMSKVSGDSFACTMKGTNLAALSQIILENAQDTTDHVYAVGIPSIAAADPSQATVSFKTKDLQQLKGTSYKIYYELKGQSPQASNLKVTVQQVISITPEGLVFGSQTLSTASTAQASVLTNRSNAALSVTSITITGTNSGDFAQANTCGAAVAAGANCTISVTFRPTGTGSRTASVNITDNGPGSPQAITLSGTGTAAPAPAVTLNPAALAFGSQTVNSTSTAQSVTLTNSGNAALSITGITITGTNSGDFTQATTCVSPVAAGANCTISVTFRPTATGSKTASVNIADDAAGSPQAITLSGTGTAAP